MKLKLIVQDYLQSFFEKMRTKAWRILISPLLAAANFLMKLRRQISEDITDRKHAEEANRRLEDLLKFSPEAMFIWRLENGIEVWNRSAERLYGFSATEVMGRNPHQLLQTEAPISWKEIEIHMRKYEWWEGDLVHKTRDGRRITVSARLQLIQDTFGSDLVFESNRDITERKLAEDAMKKNENLLQAIIEGTPDAIYMKNKKGVYKFFNNAAAKFVGKDKNEVIGKDDTYIFPYDRAKVVMADDQTVFSSGKVTTFEETFTTLSGKRIVLLTIKGPIFDQNGNVESIFGISRDLTERKHMEELLDEAKNSAEKANQAKDLFLSTLSHELRTPLTAILSWVQLLRSGRLAPAQTELGLQTIEDAAHTQNQLISDILDISRISAGKIALDTQEIELKGVVNKAIKMIHHLAEKKSIHISESLTTDPVFVTGDPMRLEQIFWNLLSNSIKFTPSGGKIDVTLEVINDPSEPTVRISVRDTGRGIPPTFLPHIFELFSQANSTSTRVHRGLGLGLALAQKLTYLHNGTIDAHSEGEGKGATFIVTLPLNVTPQFDHDYYVSQATEVTAPTQRSLSGLRILLVDDEKSTLDSIKETLSFFGAQVKTASSVSQAIDEFDASTPNVIVSDIAMPNEDGYSLIQKIRKRGHKGGDTPAIALTAYADSQTRQKALDAGFQAHLAKPVDSNDLVRTILKVNKAS